MQISGFSGTRTDGSTGWRFALLAILLSSGLAACTSAGASPEPPTAAPTVTATGTATANPGKPPLAGPTVTDSFGNADFYTTVSGDTFAVIAAAFGISESKLYEFNAQSHGAPLAPNTKLRLIPAEGPITGASGSATVDANGIPISYVIEASDTLDGITYRFGLTKEQLAEANKVPFVYEQGNKYFVRAGNHIQLQKNPVDSRSGKGKMVNNSFGHTIFYTTVDGDSFDSLGYQFRSTTAQLLRYNPSLVADKPIPAGTKVSLMSGEQKIDGAQGTFTADAEGIPLTYTTAPGDTETQIVFRFGLTGLADLAWANRPLTGDGGVWYDYTDVPSGELAPGQTISLALNKPINK
jgi:LysM repeat protein